MPFCSVDKGMLEQIIYNLLNNAIVHAGPQSKIDISASCHGDLLEIAIEDNGKGFTDIDVKDVFNKFSRDKNQEKHPDQVWGCLS